MPGRSFKTKVIVNPVAGSGRAGRQWPALKRALEDTAEAPLLGDVAHTQRPHAATRLTREALRSGCDRILAVGGDGTLGEVVSGFWEEDGRRINPDAVLTPVACGTAGDFARTVGDHTGPLSERRVRTVDVGRVSYTTAEGETRTRHFLNVASFGMGGAVTRRVHQSRLPSWLGGQVTFFLTIAQVFLSYRCRRVALHIDGEDVGTYRVYAVAVANGRYFGGGLEVAPRAAPDDGLLDVVVIGNVSRLRFLQYMRHLYVGTHRTLPQVHTFRGKCIRARPLPDGDGASGLHEAQGSLEADGEPLGGLPATFEVLPRALQVQC